MKRNAPTAQHAVDRRARLARLLIRLFDLQATCTEMRQAGDTDFALQTQTVKDWVKEIEKLMAERGTR